MKISKLSIKEFRNFKDFEISFSEGYNIDVILGINGIGKSSLLEFIEGIFTLSPYSNDYIINYTYKGSVVELVYNDELVNYKIDNRNIIWQGLGDVNWAIAGKDYFPYFSSYVYSDLHYIKDNQYANDGEYQFNQVSKLLSDSPEEALLLLDGPTTFSSPNKSYQFFENVDIAENSHVIIATHDPLLILGLDKSQIHILEYGEDGLATVRNPDRSPRGMGVAGLLTSDMFGLHSTLDKPTLDLLDEKRKLASRKAIGPDEQKELLELNNQLIDLGFSQSFRDPLFEEFTKSMARNVEYREMKHQYNMKKAIDNKNKTVDNVLGNILKGKTNE